MGMENFFGKFFAEGYCDICGEVITRDSVFSRFTMLFTNYTLCLKCIQKVEDFIKFSSNPDGVVLEKE